MPRPYDLILYGVGYTGRLTARYLARAAPPTLKWALAARNASKLETLRAELLRDFPSLSALPVMVADSDAQGATLVASSARVVISTAGPFALCGSELIGACARLGTHYADATGETFWAREMEIQHGAAAKASRAIIVPLSGFDSVPSDLGTLFVVEAARAQNDRVDSVLAVAHMRGSLSGGTTATAFNMAASPDARSASADPLLLVPGESAAARAELAAAVPDVRSPERVPSLGASVWTTNHVMASINTRVVRRSAALFRSQGEALRAGSIAGSAALRSALPRPLPNAGNGKDDYAFSLAPFAYDERALTRSWWSAFTRNTMAKVISIALSPLFAPCVRPLLPKQGEGPSDADAAKCWFKLFLVGHKEGTPVDADPIVCCVSGADPYVATGHSLAETGLLLVEASVNDKIEDLPASAFGYGFLTPATALGLKLVDRLNATGMKFETFSTLAAATAAASPRAK